ncbi:hypothetical protein KIN20_008210 [Parelaphostrongylus tenuis]|uniref:Uncharacterized protein n=1 Tax=Parelaphostrongylus tenuis TaxID=148309 RepID=A0AAD5M9A3_PARTN|nr:hypothetical protein KIN20_008210 [Parelaphostrongylus tenuis]
MQAFPLQHERNKLAVNFLLENSGKEELLELILASAKSERPRSPAVNVEEVLSERDVRMKIDPNIMKTIKLSLERTKVFQTHREARTPLSRMVEKAKDQVEMIPDQPLEKTQEQISNLHSMETLDYPNFLDRHYTKIEPGVLVHLLFDVLTDFDESVSDT